ncbi:MAG: endonuclease [Bacilli bacterium]|jgi:endonuclease I
MKIRKLLLGLVALTILSACKPTSSSEPTESSETPSVTSQPEVTSEPDVTSDVVSSSEESSSAPSSSEWVPPTPVWQPALTMSFTPMAEYSGSFWNTIDFNLRGEDLKTALFNYLNPKKKLITYGETMGALREMDRDPSNSNNILSIYDLKSHPGATYNGGKWNKEHSYPQSKLKDGNESLGASNNVANISSDVANLFASDADLNTTRSNNSYGEWNYTSDPQTLYEFTLTNTAGQRVDSILRRGYFSPTPLVRGEIARAQLYMLVMYPTQCALGENFAIQTMIKWDREHVPTVERDGQRQTGIQKYQEIRNPFIDNRNLSCYIWGDTNIQTRSLCNGIY